MKLFQKILIDWLLKRHLLSLLTKLNGHKMFLGGILWFVGGVIAYLGGPEQVSWAKLVLPLFEQAGDQATQPPIPQAELVMVIGHVIYIVGVLHRLWKWATGQVPPGPVGGVKLRVLK